jgi:hypothetical protein
MNNRDLAALLCAASTTLAEAHRRHLAAYGTLIPHVYMGEVLGHVGRRFGEVGRTGAWELDGELGTILGALDRAVAEGDRETRNVVALSFVRDGELEWFFAQLRPHFGPALRMQLTGR